VGSVVIGHLGPRVSALLDGQLGPQETEEAWAHVYSCHACRDLVEREGWIKTRLANLSCDPGTPPVDLKGSLLSVTPGEQYLVARRPAGRRGMGAAVLGGGAIGAAMLGVLALGTAPSSPPADRRPPVTRIDVPAATPTAQAPEQRSTPASRQRPATARASVPAWIERLVP